MEKKYDQEEVFWTQYVDMEQTKTSEYRIDIFGSLSTFFFNLLDYQPTAKERMIYRNFIAKTRPSSILAGICILILMGASFSRYTRSANDHNSYHAVHSLVMIWVGYLFISTMLVLGLSTRQGLAYLPTMNYDITDVIDVLGRSLFLFRLLRFVQAVTYLYVENSGDGCIESAFVHPEDHSFHLIAERIALDSVTIIFLSQLPYRRVHIIGLFIVESIFQSCRILTCKNRLGDVPDRFDLYIWTVISAFTGMLSFIMLISSFSLDRSISATYKNMEKMRVASAEKTSLINTLCNDLKIPVQQTSSLLNHLVPYVTQHDVGSRGRFCQDLGYFLNSNLSAISAVIDHTLFLMRIREGRYVFTCEDDVLLAEVLSKTLKDLLTCNRKAAAASASAAANSTGDREYALDGLFQRLFSINIHIPSKSDKQCRVDKLCIQSSRGCLSILLFYAVSAVLLDASMSNNNCRKGEERDGTWGKEEVRTNVDDHVGIDISIYRKQDLVGAASSKSLARKYESMTQPYVLICNITSNARKDRPYVSKSSQSDHDQYHYQTCMMYCQEVCRSTGGHVSFFSNGKVEFSLPCVYREERSGMRLTEVKSSKETRRSVNMADNRSNNDNKLDEPSSSNNNVLQSMLLSVRLKEQQNPLQTINPNLYALLGIYSPDSTITSLLIENLSSVVDGGSAASSRPTTAGLSAGHSGKSFPIAVFSQLNMADMHARRIVMVTSMEDCQRLRMKGYRDKIALMSERLAYYDNSAGHTYDYAVSIPLSSRLELAQFVQWINDRCLEEEDADESLKDKEQTVIVKKQSFVLHTFVSSMAFLSFAMYANTLGLLFQVIPALDSQHMLNYVRWRYLNPSAYWLHHTCSMEFYLLVTLCLLLSLKASDGITYDNTFFAFIPIFSFIIWRRVPYTIFVSWKSKLLTIMHVTFAVLTISATVQLFRALYHANSYAKEHHNVNLTAFLDFHTLFIGGKLLFIYPIQVPSTIKLFSELVMWPYGFLIGLTFVGLVFIVLHFFLSTVIDNLTIRFMYILELLVIISVMGTILLTERLRRKEYMKLREVILSQDFVARCANACWHNTVHPLSAITDLQCSIYEHIHRQCVGREIYITPTLQQRLEALNRNVMLSKELLQGMRMSLSMMNSHAAGGNSKREVSDLAGNMETHLLCRAVESVCALFLVESAPKESEGNSSEGYYETRYRDRQSSLQIFVKIHPSVALIRFDKALLQALLHSLCRSAVKRMEGRGRDRSRGKKAKAGGDELLVLIAPAAGQEGLKFTDVHMLRIQVYDTALDRERREQRGERQRQKGREQEKGEEEESLSDCCGNILASIYERYVQQHYTGEEGEAFLRSLSHTARSKDSISSDDKESERNHEGEEDPNCPRSRREASSSARLHSLQHAQDSHYHTVQSLFFPYKLLPLSHTVSQFLSPSPSSLSPSPPSSPSSSSSSFSARSLVDLPALSLPYTKPYARYRNKFPSSFPPPLSSSLLPAQPKRLPPSVYAMPTRDNPQLVLLLSSSREGDSVSLQQLPSVYSSLSLGWDRKVCFLSPHSSQSLPRLEVVREAACIVVDGELLAQSPSKRYGAQLLLYLRAQRCEGVVVLARPGTGLSLPPSRAGGGEGEREREKAGAGGAGGVGEGQGERRGEGEKERGLLCLLLERYARAAERRWGRGSSRVWWRWRERWRGLCQERRCAT